MMTRNSEILQQLTWENVPLRALTSKIGSGATPRGGSNNYKLEGLSLIRSQNVLDFSFSMDGLALIDGEQAAELSNVIVKENDVLLNITGDSVARCCVVPESVLPARVNQHVAIIRVDESKADHRFVFYSLQASKEELLTRSEIGATRRALTKGMIEDFPIACPPLVEQRAISELLSSLDDKIDLLHRQNKTLGALAETLFRQWFIEEANDDWEFTTFAAHFDAYRGLSYKGSGLTELGFGLPMHNLNSVFEGGGYKEAGIKYYAGEFKDRHIVHAGDVIVANTEQGHEFRLIGFPAIVPRFFGESGIFSQHIYKIVPKTTTYLSREYLNYLIMLPDIREQITSATNGSTVNMLAIDGLQRPAFKLPPESTVNKFTSYAKECRKKTELNHDAVRTLEKLRDTLLPKLMSGEVRVANE